MIQESSPKPKSALESVLAFAAGALFSVGLALAGMTQPGKVVGFLDFAGDWDPSLAFVMVGAIGVYFTLQRVIRGRSVPWAGGIFHLPTRRDIEPNLVMGAALFGIGWGLAGYCPGPALTSVATGAGSALLFVACMAVGMLGFEGLQRARSRRAHAATESLASRTVTGT